MVDPPVTLTAQHARRLRSLWRSAGWPSHDVLEAELLLAGALEGLLVRAGGGGGDHARGSLAVILLLRTAA